MVMCVPKFWPVCRLLVASAFIFTLIRVWCINLRSVTIVSNQSPWQYSLENGNFFGRNINFFAPPFMESEQISQPYETLLLWWQAVILLSIKLLHHAELWCCHSRWWNKWSLHSMATWQRYEHECAAIGVYWQVWWKISHSYNARGLQSWTWSNEVRKWNRTIQQSTEGHMHILTNTAFSLCCF